MQNCKAEMLLKSQKQRWRETAL